MTNPPPNAPTILNIGSFAARSGSRGQSAYAAAKAGLAGPSGSART
jgi:NAD(P)-dependent dehydrogenase (short-subunit alcohol dehydrogenase family)